MGLPCKNSASYRVPTPIGPSVIFSTRFAFGFHSGSRVRSVQ
jgi:hypothetical protein